MTDFDKFSSYVNSANIVAPSLILQSLATEYNIDVGFAYATWCLETGYGKSNLWINHNNPAGIKRTDGSGEYMSYRSQEEGLRAMFELIKYYCGKGMNTVKEIRSMWSETEDTDVILEIWEKTL